MNINIKGLLEVLYLFFTVLYTSVQSIVEADYLNSTSFVKKYKILAGNLSEVSN